MSKVSDSMTFDLLHRLIDLYNDTIFQEAEINKLLMTKKIRHSNFPSHISENIVKFAFFKKYRIMPSWDTKKGDLVLNKINCKEIQLEVKAFLSKGPSSFGPTEKWDRIYFIDCSKTCDKVYTVYEIKLSNDNNIWKNIKINKKDTYEDQCKQGRRPRINFDQLRLQIKDNIEVLFTGHISQLKP